MKLPLGFGGSGFRVVSGGEFKVLGWEFRVFGLFLVQDIVSGGGFR